MLMYFRWSKPFDFFQARSKSLLAAGLLTTMGLTGCSGLSFNSAGGPRASLESRLQAEPAACSAYRVAYVNGFKTHVDGMSEKQDTLQREGLDEFEVSRKILASNGLGVDDCIRPFCIIEPLQGGKLDSWCGYKVLKTDGPELYQWFEWTTVQP
jgi:hypothetical protein